MNRSRARWLHAFGAVGLAALCQNTTIAAESPAEPSAAQTDESRRAVEQARQALESKQQWIEGFTLESVTATQWSDSSLGCRKPGSQYMQVITSGYTVKFVGKDARREVHVAGEQAVVCNSGFPRIAPGASRPRVSLRKADAMITAARTDLAGKLSGTPDEVKVVRWDTVYLPLRMLHCEGGPGAVANPSEPAVPGYKILLDHRGRTYVYYSDMDTATACPPIEVK